MAATLFDNSPRPAVERLARIDGQSNFLSLLAGVEAGADTTEDMGALSFARQRDCVPEVLEAAVAQSNLFKRPLMSMVFDAILAELSPPQKDWPWIQGAVADAFLLMQQGECKPLRERAKSFHVDSSVYSAIRKIASGAFTEMIDCAENAWKQARRSEIPEKCHTQIVDGPKAPIWPGGCHTTPALPTDAHPDNPATDAHAIGFEDRLGWDERRLDKPGDVLTLKGAEARAHCKWYPAQPGLNNPAPK